MRFKDLICNNYISGSILVLVILVVYWPVFFNQFLMQWDDGWVPMNIYTESGFSFYNLWNVLVDFYNGQYAPVNELFYMILYRISGNSYNPMVFHVSCLLIHIVNVLLIYHFIKNLLLQSRSFEFSSIIRIAFLTALLVAIHPFLVESVAWISASKIILYVMFFLVGLLFYLKYNKTQRIKYWFFTFLFFILSFGAKEQAVVMPLILLIIDFALKRNFKDKKIWIEKIPFFLLALFFSIITVFSQGPINLSDPNSYPMYQRIAFASYSLFEYFTKLILPVKLSYLYPFPNQPGEILLFRFWLYPLVLVVLIIGLWGYFKRKVWLLFALAWFVAGLLPALHIVSLARFAIIADRYVYLSAIGVFFGLAYLLDIGFIYFKKNQRLFLMSVFVYVFALGAYTYIRTKVWHSNDTLKKELREQLKQRNDYYPLKEKSISSFF